jgi:hypothetical protein
LANVAQVALQESDRDVAEAVIEAGWVRFSAREKIAARSALKRTFPETPEEWKERRNQASSEQRSNIASALESRLKGRRERATTINERSKKSAGPSVNIPIDEQDQYTKREPFGFNLPVNSDASGATRKGAGRAKVVSAAQKFNTRPAS